MVGESLDLLELLEQLAVLEAGLGGLSLVTPTTYGYDVADHLVSVTDTEGNETTYAYSDRDLLTQEVSPVSGTTTHAYNQHGELVSTTDARGILVQRTVDELDRVTFVDSPDPALDTTYIYDTAPPICGGESFPVGRLGSILRGQTTVTSCYDRFGRPTRDGELTYAYDPNGNLTDIAYPGGVSAGPNVTLTAPYEPLGPNSNTFAGQLARECCENGEDIVNSTRRAPGINHASPGRN